MPLGARAYNNGKQLEIQLGPDRVQQLKLLLTEGKSVKGLVSVVQGEWGLFTDKKPSTVQTMIYRYSRETVKKEAVQRVMATVERRGHVKVSTLEDLADLCEKQKRRVIKAMALEDKMNGMVTDLANNQIRLLADMLSKLAFLQLETGLLPRAPKTVKGVMVGTDGQVTAFGWTENDDDLLNHLTHEIQVTDEHHDEPGFAE
jgi:hypothetical protein